jgi:hypothetical protein
MPIALLMFPSACAALQLRKVRTTFGSRVRRSLLSMPLIDAEEAHHAGRNISENITELERSNEPNPLNIGSPTRARTWDLRINSTILEAFA